MGAAKVGVVLSSGGPRGLYAHTGFLQALDGLRIEYHALAGCSAGAIVGGLDASGAARDDWTGAIADLRTEDFWRPDRWWSILWHCVARRGRGYTGLSDVAPAGRFCSRSLGVGTFEECRYPFRVLARSLSRNRKVVFSEGELTPRIMASAAIPLLYRPVEIDGEWFCDGAVVEFAPIDAICCEQGLDVVLVHHVSASRQGAAKFDRLLDQPWSFIRIVDWIVYDQRPWYLTGDLWSTHRCPCRCGARIVVVEPELPDLLWPDVERGEAVREAARSQASRALASFFASEDRG